jgi:hypothetical protein
MARRASTSFALILLVAACSLVAACTFGSADKIHVGRWIGTRTFGETDGTSAITADAALDVARKKLVELGGGPNPWPFARELAGTAPVAAGFVPSMVRVDLADGSSTYTSTDAADSWVFEFGRPGRGAIVVVNADHGTVGYASNT